MSPKAVTSHTCYLIFIIVAFSLSLTSQGEGLHIVRFGNLTFNAMRKCRKVFRKDTFYGSIKSWHFVASILTHKPLSSSIFSIYLFAIVITLSKKRDQGPHRAGNVVPGLNQAEDNIRSLDTVTDF